MRPSILLIGSTGQVGRELNRLLPRIGEVIALDRQRLDLAKPSEIRGAVQNVRPDLIVNAAAYTAVDAAERESSLARAVNANAPSILADEAKIIGAPLIHFSTDYVFDGLKTTPYEERDPPNPRNVYGQTKLDGERAIEHSGAVYLIFRTSWVYATTGRNFVLTMLRLATQREELRVVSDQIGAPTWSAQIALATTHILGKLCGAENMRQSLWTVSGTYHMTAAGETSWYEFARAILEEAKKTSVETPWLAAATECRPLIVRRVTPILAREYDSPVRRPAYSVLSNDLLTRTFGERLPDWRTQLRSAFAGDLSAD